MRISDDYYPIAENSPMATAVQVERIMRETHCSEETAALIVLANYILNLKETIRLIR